jgi:uncharacterized membrane protein YphA (DoxX/SURF4 family)
MNSRNANDSPDRTSDWAVRICVAAVFTLTGAEKFSDSAFSWVQTFGAIGLGQWFRYFTGGVEVLGAVLFLVPAATMLGAAMLIATMCGAMAVQVIVFHHPANMLFPGVYLLGVALAFAKLRSSSRRAL